jgi:hypothetical protein
VSRAKLIISRKAERGSRTALVVEEPTDPFVEEDCSNNRWSRDGRPRLRITPMSYSFQNILLKWEEVFFLKKRGDRLKL